MKLSELVEKAKEMLINFGDVDVTIVLSRQAIIENDLEVYQDEIPVEDIQCDKHSFTLYNY